MNKLDDINKASGIILKNGKVLVGRSVGKEYFIHPGGKIEPGESSKQALVRELKEEFSITVDEAELLFFDHNTAPAANSPEVDVHMDVFIVKKWQGEIKPSHEIEEMLWLSSQIPKDIKIGSIMEHETIPELKIQGLID